MVAFRFAVGSTEDGRRLDDIIKQRYPSISRRLLKLAFAEGRVTVAGQVARKSDLAQLGQCVTIDRVGLEPAPDDTTQMVILFESEEVVIVDKPAGVPCVPLQDGETGTVVNWLLAHYPAMKGFGYAARDAGLVHRLDTGTSGVLIAAKTQKAFEALVDALKRGHVHKSYLAWTTGVPSAMRGVIRAPLRPDPHNKKKVRLAALGERGARSCVTHYQVLDRANGICLIRAHAPVATRHQIRAHLASVGCPLLSDELYGGTMDERLSRHALHAERAIFEGADGVESFDCESPIPEDLSHLTAPSG